MTVSNSANGAPLRARAAKDLAAVLSGKSSLNQLYKKWASDDADRDRALQRALVTGCLRWHFQLDAQLQQLLNRPLPDKDIVLNALLRIGLFQLQHMRIPDHASVAATVAATPLIQRRHARGLVNAVLRRFLRERDALETALKKLPQSRLNHPQWLIDVIESDWPESAAEIFSANNQSPPQWLRINPRKTNRAEYAAVLDENGINYELDAELDHALMLRSALPIAQLPGYLEGLVSVQDRSAQLAADFVAAGTGDRILDACAAPGGKTAHLLERFGDQCELVAIDEDTQRLQTLNANLHRLGLDTNVIQGDASTPQSWWDGKAFDRILIDAPCSATGVIRRHPDIKLRRSPTQVSDAVELQGKLLVALWPLLAPGGRMIYATCSVLRDENDRQIARFCAAEQDRTCLSEHQYLPGEANGDGFYYATLVKQQS